MGYKLGELLLRVGAINQDQLNEALSAQKVYGGKLGTNLVELGHITERELAHILSRQMNIPFVDASQFDHIPREALQSIPTAIAEKYRVIPISIKGRKVNLAMSDPTNYAAVDEISFATGLSLTPMVAPEILIVYALERYYGVARSVRYIRLSSLADQLVQQKQPSGKAAPSLAMPSHESAYGQNEAGSTTGRVKNQERGYSLATLSTDLAEAKELGDVFDIIQKVIGEDFHRLALFVFKGEMVRGLTQRGCTISSEEFQQLTFPCLQSELFKKVCKTKMPYTGTVIHTPLDDKLLLLLGIPLDERIFCVPVMVNNLPAAVILAADPRKGELLEIAASYYSLIKKIGLALEMLYIKKQILDVSEF